MRRWKDVGSVESIQSHDDSQHRSHRSRSRKSMKDSPVTPFRQNIRNQTELFANDKEKTFCSDYMERKRDSAKTITIEMMRDDRLKGSLKGEDIFTEMRNVLKQDDNASRVTTKSLSDPESRTNDPKQKGKQLLKKTNSKLRTLKKDQCKLKKHLQSDISGMKNMFYQLQQVLHSYKPDEKQKEKPVEKNENHDPQFLRQIVMEALSVQRHFKELERKKREIMMAIENE